MTAKSKVCVRCGEKKTVAKNFGVSPRAKDGLRSYCRPCDSLASKASRAKKAKAVATPVRDTSGVADMMSFKKVMGI